MSKKIWQLMHLLMIYGAISSVHWVVAFLLIFSSSYQLIVGGLILVGLAYLISVFLAILTLISIRKSFNPVDKWAILPAILALVGGLLIMNVLIIMIVKHKVKRLVAANEWLMQTQILSGQFRSVNNLIKLPK